MKKFILLILFTHFVNASDIFDFSLGLPQTSAIKELKLWATYYYLPQVRSIDNGFALRDMQGAPLGPTLARRDWCNAALQGSVIVLDDENNPTTYNYAGKTNDHKVDCSMYWSFDSSVTKFTKAKGPYGDGVRNYKLVPYRTIAVDQHKVTYGSILFIPAAVGNVVVLPDGSTALHDGYFFAGDTGSRIKGKHIDVYIGTASKNPFNWVKSKKEGIFKAFLVKDKKIIDYLTKIHR